jgi:glycolate oxidase iron-sulfur subunit
MVDYETAWADSSKWRLCPFLGTAANVPDSPIASPLSLHPVSWNFTVSDRIAPLDRSRPCDRPQQQDLDRCVHCGLCLNACPTYRELGLEADSPRGRIYQMVQVAEGKSLIGDDYVEHIGLCLACRACETACPSGVQYGRLVEAARAQIAANREISPWARAVRSLVYGNLLVTPGLIKLVGYFTLLYQQSGLQWLVRHSGVLKLLGRLGELERLMPPAEYPFFFRRIGKRYPARGDRKYRVAFLAGCIANVSFARLNEATVRVLTRNGCEVVVPEGQGCCGALHVHAGLRDQGREQAKINIQAVEGGDFDAIITNAAGCGSTLKEYADLFEHDPEWHARAHAFSAKMRDVSEFLASIELNRNLGPLPYTVTYQDSCHLLHGQKVRVQPRKMLEAIPELKFRELPLSEICCGSAGVYNVEHTEMAMELLQKKMQMVETTGAEMIVTANPGCMLQLRAGAEMFSRGQRVVHVVELLDASYRKAEATAEAR